MGNQVQQPKIPQTTSLHVLAESETGQIVQDPHACTYLLRQVSFSNEHDYKRILNLLKAYCQQQQCQQMTKLLRIQPKQDEKICGSSYKILLYFEYSQISLWEEVNARSEVFSYFDFEDICSIIKGCIEALDFAEKQLKNFNEKIQQNLFSRVFINLNRILLMENGAVKIPSPLLVSPLDRYTKKNRCYYSPEKLGDFGFDDDEKSSVFELGLTLLHLITLKDCKNVYNGFEVKQDEINRRISEVWFLYQSEKLCELLTKMTQTLRSRRIGLKECLILVNNMMNSHIVNVTTVKSLTTTSRKKDQKSSQKQNLHDTEVVVESLKPHNFLAAFRSSIEGSCIESYQYGKEGLVMNYKSVNKLQSKAKLVASTIKQNSQEGKFIKETVSRNVSVFDEQI